MSVDSHHFPHDNKLEVQGFTLQDFWSGEGTGLSIFGVGWVPRCSRTVYLRSSNGNWDFL